MTTSRGFTANDYQNGTNFYTIDDMQPTNQRFTPIGLRSQDRRYQYQERENGYREQTSHSSERSEFCSKKCLIGLAIGLAIGIVLVIAIAVPIGVIKQTCSIGTISSTPNWIGTFQMDNGCDTSQCCCLSNQITLTQTTGNLLQIAGSITGQCTSFSSPISLATSTPTDFQSNFLWGAETIRLQLGQDNSYLSFVNIYHGRCSATALRTSYNVGSMKSINSGLIMFILLITIGIMK